MQTLEAVFSLMFFLSISSLLLSSFKPYQLDDSLYRIQLANDAWRMLYLRGDLEDFSDDKRDAIERDMQEIGKQTGLCFFLNGTQYSNCRGGDDPHENTVSIKRTVIGRGGPETLSFSISK